MTPLNPERATLGAVSRYGEVYTALMAADVPFVVVGGTAVVLQGHPRLTVDLDLVVDLRAAPLRRAIGALLGLGLRARLPVDPYDFADPVIRERWRQERALTVFSFFDPTDPFREVDLARPLRSRLTSFEVGRL